MTMYSIESSAIRAVGYEGQTLAVVFRTSATVYLHHSVPHWVYSGLMRASSKGAFYNHFIRGKYR